MATLTAVRHEPLVRTMYQRLRANGKAKKVALVACMRKFLVILNARVREHYEQNPLLKLDNLGDELLPHQGGAFPARYAILRRRAPLLPAHEAMRVAYPGDREAANVGNEFMRKVAAGAALELGDDRIGDSRVLGSLGENILDPVSGNQAARLVLMCQAHPGVTGRIEPALPREPVMDEAESGDAGIGCVRERSNFLTVTTFLRTESISGLADIAVAYSTSAGCGVSRISGSFGIRQAIPVDSIAATPASREVDSAAIVAAPSPGAPPASRLASRRGPVPAFLSACRRAVPDRDPAACARRHATMRPRALPPMLR